MNDPPRPYLRPARARIPFDLQPMGLASTVATTPPALHTHWKRYKNTVALRDHGWPHAASRGVIRGANLGLITFLTRLCFSHAPKETPLPQSEHQNPRRAPQFWRQGKMGSQHQGQPQRRLESKQSMGGREATRPGLHATVINSCCPGLVTIGTKPIPRPFHDWTDAVHPKQSSGLSHGMRQKRAKQFASANAATTAVYSSTKITCFSVSPQRLPSMICILFVHAALIYSMVKPTRTSSRAKHTHLFLKTINTSPTVTPQRFIYALLNKV